MAYFEILILLCVPTPSWCSDPVRVGGSARAPGEEGAGGAAAPRQRNLACRLHCGPPHKGPGEPQLAG